jgi:hypothetical protein
MVIQGSLLRFPDLRVIRVIPDVELKTRHKLLILSRERHSFGAPLGRLLLGRAQGRLQLCLIIVREGGLKDRASLEFGVSMVEMESEAFAPAGGGPLK